MANLDKLYRLHQILDGRRTPIRKRDLAERLDRSEKSVDRHIMEMRDYYGAPILVSGAGVFYDRSRADSWELPGLWMTRDETQSLLLLLDILNRFGNGLMNEELKGVRSRIDRMLASRGVSRKELERRVRIIPIGHRVTGDLELSSSFNALVDRKQLYIKYQDFRSQRSNRSISPQRLIYYRDNWYLHAWCHTKNGLRTFSIARISHSAVTDEHAIEIAEEELDDYFKSSYGVFAGSPRQWARLRFLPAVAAEIARQRWHPDQVGKWEELEYVLTIPYSQSTELMQDILKHTPYVVIEEPPTLREELTTRLKESLDCHGEAG